MRPFLVNIFCLTLTAGLLVSCGSGRNTLSLLQSDALVYEVVFDGTPIELLLEIEHRQPDVVMKYHMGFEEPKSGKITITSEAMSQAHEQDYFWEGDKVNDHKTALWVSSSVYQDITSNGEVEMSFRQGFTLHKLRYKLIDRREYALVYNGNSKKVTALYLEDTSNKGFKYWILDNPTDPLILRMDVGWNLLLKQIIHL